KSGSVFMNCRLGSHINAAGWTKMGEETWKDCSFLEYKSLTADGTALADVSRRVSWSGQVSEDDRYYLMNLKYIYSKVNASSAFDPLPMAAAPQAPSGLTKTGNVITWTAVPEAECYAIYADGRLLDYATTNSYCDIKSSGSPKYQVKAIGAYGNMSGFNGSAKMPTAQELDSILSPDYRVKLTTKISDEKAGKITVNPNTPSYDKDAMVTLSAEHNYGYRFLQWQDEQGNVLSTENPYQHKMDRAITITAVFRKLPLYKLTLNQQVEGSYAKYLPKQIITTDAQPQTVGDETGYEEGHVLTIQVKDHPIFRFQGWEDGSDAVERRITMDADKSVQATFTQADFLAAWNFGQRQYDYYQPDMNPGDVVAEINLINENDDYLTWDRYEGGYYDNYAIVDNSGQKSFFDLDIYVGPQKSVYLWSKIKVTDKGYSRYNLEYSIDGGDSYVPFSSVEVPALDTWTTLSAEVPALALAEESFRIRWIADYSAATLGQTQGASTTVLSDVFLLKDVFTSINPASTALSVWMKDDMLYLCGDAVQHVQLFDVNGRLLLARQHCDKLDMSAFSDGVYLLKVWKSNQDCEMIKCIKQ
ncbi:MAG: hypothetical protein J6Q26_02805, partial [Bacteroidales bacterium]|nr:hypothetical protein [Bacteroidales bacterium]